MTQIISPDKISSLLKTLRENHSAVVLAGGCFDILHVGHVRFLRQAKALGDALVILLESDETVRRLKGNTRPYFTQAERAEMLSQLKSVDIVVTLPPLTTDEHYSKIVRQIHPAVIALTERDVSYEKKQVQAQAMNAKIAVIPHIETHSTSSLAELLGVE